MPVLPTETSAMSARGRRHSIIPPVAGAAIGLLLGLTGAPAALAETDCQGLEEAKCNTRPNCAWVDPYERKDGVKVMGYCRAKNPDPWHNKDRSGRTPIDGRQ